MSDLSLDADEGAEGFGLVYCPTCRENVDPDVEPEQIEEYGPYVTYCPVCETPIEVESDEIADSDD